MRAGLAPLATITASHLSQAAKHVSDRLGNHLGVIPLHQSHTIVRAREELVLLRQLDACSRGRLQLVDYLPSLHQDLKERRQRERERGEENDDEPRQERERDRKGTRKWPHGPDKTRGVVVRFASAA